LAGKLPMDVISELIGVPPADRDEVRRLADLLVHREQGVHDVPPAGMEAALTLAGYYAELLAERRRRRTGDLTSALLDAELDGEPVPAGGRVLLLIGSANRDPRAFGDDADRYDLDRDTSELASFGSGRHFCLGASLARLEARVALEEVVARVRDYDVDAEQ